MHVLALLSIIIAFTFNCFLIPSYFVVSFLPTSFTTLFLISTKAKRWSSNQYVYIQRKRKSGISPFQLPSPSTNSESQLIRDPASDRVFDSWVVLDRLELPSPPMSFTFFRLLFFESFVVVSIVWLAYRIVIVYLISM